MNNVSIDKLKYQPNKLGYNLIILSILLGIIGFFTIINFNSFDDNQIKVIPDFRLALEILFTIFIILLTFLAAVNVKKYSLKWSIITIVISMYFIIRIFEIPLDLLKSNQITTYVFVKAVIFYILTFICLSTAGIYTIIKHNQIQKLNKLKGETV